MKLAFLFTGLVLSSTFAWADDWPQFRGPDGDGHAQGDGYVTTWSQEENVKWKHKMPAPGNGSPIVSNGCVLVQCAEDGGKKRSLLCINRGDGKLKWKKTVNYDKPDTTHQTNPHCGSTPCTDGQCIVAWFGSAGLYCYTFDGEQLWKLDLGEFKHIWGSGSSPNV